ncbi:MAG: glutamine--fructose-6-phosphate transaminase (isomerizing) [Dehalococcoidales bacterium]
MCGIVGYIGDKQAHQILLNCLEKLEYRGYDSCGIAIASDDIKVIKDTIRVKAMADSSPRLEGTAGIGHTRWATHGPPSQINAHPQIDCPGNIAVVHNGIINNYQELKDLLIEEGHNFVSETDTEVLSHLIEKYYKGNLEEATEAALKKVEGSYTIIVIAKGEPKLVVARKDSPLIIGLGDRENFIASDVPAILDYTDRVIYLEDGDIGAITSNEIKIKRNGAEIKPDEQKVMWTVEEAQKSGYEHFLLKEIHETPKVIRNTLAEYTREMEPVADLAGMKEEGVESVLMIATGTSYYAVLTGKYIIEELLGIPVRVEISSEFNYYSHTLAKTVAIAICQSGETADTLKAMKKLREAGCRVIVISNVVGSTATRIANQTIYTRAGPEISVAASKTFTAQLMVLYWLAMSHSKGDSRRVASLLLELRQLPNKAQQVLDNESQIMEQAKFLSRFENAFFVGRGINYPIALEGALKLKEISYIHAEGYAAGETKHGPYALLGPNTPVIALAARDNTYEPLMNNLKQIKARGSPIIALAEEGDTVIEEVADYIIPVPRVDTLFSPVVNVIALQLLAYYTAKERGCPIDNPRHLAKTLTVE